MAARKKSTARRRAPSTSRILIADVNICIRADPVSTNIDGLLMSCMELVGQNKSGKIEVNGGTATVTVTKKGR